MSDKKYNEIIEEQKKARKAYLELKKMQSGELATGPKPSEVAIVPKTFWQKLKNFWYHDKKVVIVSLLMVFVITVMTVQCATQEKADLKIVLFTYSPVMDEYSKKMGDYFEKYCDDINGDGKVVVKVINCSFDAKNDTRSYRKTKIIRLEQTITSEESAMLYITDSRSITHFDTYKSQGIPFFVGETVALSEEFYTISKMIDFPHFEHNLSITCRRLDDTLLEKDKDAKLYYKESQKLLKKLAK